MEHIKRILTTIVALTLGYICMSAQINIGNGLEIDKVTHNFGEIMLDKGPVTCSFTLKNTGEKPVVIYNVATSCGCTDVTWTKEPIRPGMTGKISATYSNDEGPYPFNKSLTVYISDMKKPVILKLRGVSLAEEKPLADMYPVHIGPLALKDRISICGNLEQGGQKSEAVMIANISDTPVSISFTDVSPGLSVKVSPAPVPAGSTAEMSITITADRNVWGRNTYWAVPVINGKKATGKIGFQAFTKEDFSGLNEEEKSKAARPMFKESTYSFGKRKKGDIIHAEFTFRNDGKTPFRVYKVDADTCCWSHSDIPVADPGESVTFRVHVDTKDLPKGEVLTIVTLTTNSPLRPIVNLFVAGHIE